MLLAGPDLLHRLIGTVFRFKEGPIALTADIESIFLQLKVPEQEETSVDCALKRVAIDIEDEFPIAAKAIQNSFYMDDFIKSVNAPDEAINFFLSNCNPFCGNKDLNRKRGSPTATK